MNEIRIALANLRIPANAEESVALAQKAIEEAAAKRSHILCFPECFVPGYRVTARPALPIDPVFLKNAWSSLAATAAKAGIAVILGTERVAEGARVLTALVIKRDGTYAGFQDKVQIPPEEEGVYSQGSGRQIFHAGPLTFGIAICHEGWRYPETVRWAARRGAQVVFHPHFDEEAPGPYPAMFADPGIPSMRRPCSAAPQRTPATLRA